MKRTLLIILFLIALGANAQQTQLSRNNENAGDASVKNGMICPAAGLYKKAYEQSPSDRLLVKYVTTAYQCGDYSKVIAATNETKNAEALRLRYLSAFKQVLKYNAADEELCRKALSEALLQLKDEKDKQEVQEIYKDIFNG